MYEFSAILATIAFFLSLIAYLSIGAALRRAEQANEKFISQHVEIIRREMQETVRKIDVQGQRVSKLNSIFDGTLDAQRKLMEQHKLLNEEVEKVVINLATLDESIPGKFRTKRPLDMY